VDSDSSSDLSNLEDSSLEFKDFLLELVESEAESNGSG